MLSLIFIVCVEKELNQHLMTPNYNATNFNIFHHTGVLASEGLGTQWWEAVEEKMAQSRGESARLPPMWPGFKSRRRRHMWVEFVVGSLLCSEWFFSGYSSFPLSSKTNISKFQFGKESGRRRTILWMCYLQIIILFIYYFFMIRQQNLHKIMYPKHQSLNDFEVNF